MSQSKIISYIHQLPNKQKERFRLFVHSPYFNQHKKTKTLLNFILDSKKFQSENIDRELLFKKLFPEEEAYDEQKLFNVMSYLNRLFQKFLANEHLEEHEIKEKLLVIESARSRGMLSIVDNRSKYLEKLINKDSKIDSDYYFANFRLFYLLGFQREDLRRKEQGMMQSMLDNFDKYYLAEKLRLACQLYSDMMAKNVEFDFTNLEDLLTYLRNNWNKFEDDLFIQLHYTILMSQKEKNPKYYHDLRKILDNQLEELRIDDQRSLYKSAYNYCVTRINQGNNDYRTELFELYQQGLSKGLLFDNNILSEWDYKNIITIGCVTDNFDWTQDFIEDYKHKLPGDKRENAYFYNKAAFYFHQENYEKVQDLLINVQFTDVKYHINATLLLLRTYYKTMDTEALLSLIETFRIFIMRNKEIQTNQKKGYTNFLRFKKRLVNIKHNRGTYSKEEYQEKLNNLKLAIKHTEPVMNEYWLEKECNS